MDKIQMSVPLDEGKRPLIAKRSALFTLRQLEQIEEAAMRILEEIGIAIPDDDLLKRVAACGFPVSGNRVLIPRQLYRRFIEAERARNGNSFAAEPRPVEIRGSQIDVSMLQYHQHVHDIETDEIVPFTTDRLIQATKLVDVLASRGLVGGAPGCPVDVPPPLQPIVQYWIAANYSRNGKGPVAVQSEVTMPYVMEMAEVMGCPIRGQTVFVDTPLSLGSESLRCLMRFKDRLTSVSVGNMASLGCSVPINPGDAYAVGAAEVVGSAMVVKELTGLPVSWGIRICPIDLRHMAMVLGSAEDLLLIMANREVTAYFRGNSWYQALGGVHTNAKFPGPQACAEKASLMTAGAMLGARSFSPVGSLSLDEIFSPEQLLYDIEIKDHVQRIVAGLSGECDPERCLKDVRDAMESRIFAGLDSTAAGYRDFYWFPQLFERQLRASWQGDSSSSMRKRSHDLIRQLVGEHDYELEPELRREFDRILARAKAEFM